MSLMLMVTGLEIELTEQGERHMMGLIPPDNPGTVYRVEIDSGTAARISSILRVEVRRMAAHAAEPIEEDDCGSTWDR